MNRFKIFLITFSLFTTFSLVGPAWAADSKVSSAATALLHSVNTNSSREGTDIYLHWLQKVYPEVSFSVAYTQDYLMAVDLYDKDEYSCITLNPEAMRDPNAANYRLFVGSICSDVLKALGPFVAFESYLANASNLLLEIQKSIYNSASLNGSKDLVIAYLDKALADRVIPPELNITTNEGELKLGSSLNQGLLFILNVSKDKNGLIVVEISNLSNENILGRIDLFTGEFPASEPYLSQNPTFKELVGNEQFAYGLKSILEGIALDKLKTDRVSTTAYFTELANILTRTMPMLMVKSFDNYNFEIATDAGNLCLIYTSNSTLNLQYIVSKGYCEEDIIMSSNYKVRKELLNLEAKRLFSFLTRYAASSKKLLTMKDYNLYLKKYTTKNGIAYSVKGNVINIFDLSNPGKSATITFTKGVNGSSGIAKSGLKLKPLT
jgi:hypothetical protein